MVGSASDSLMERLSWLFREVRSLNGIGCQVQASGTTMSSCSPGGLWGRYCPMPTGLSKQAWQICPIASPAEVAKKKWLCTPSTTENEFACFGVTLRSGQLLLFPNSLCCSIFGYVEDNVDPLNGGETRVVLFAKWNHHLVGRGMRWWFADDLDFLP